MASDDKRVFKLIAKASTGVTNLVVAGSAAVGAVALHSLPVLALGGAAYAALVAWDLASAEFRKKALAGSSAPDLGRAEDYEDETTRRAVAVIHAARDELARVLDETPEEVKANLGLALVSVDELEQRAAGMARRAEDIARYLGTTDPRAVAHDVRTLAERVAVTRDAEARAQYEVARAAREEHLRTLTDLANAKERIAASLLGVAATLEGLPAKVVRMRALDAHAMDKLTGDVKDELERMNGEIQSFEDTLRTLGEIGP